MKKEEDFKLDYQTKSPITETPDPNAPKMPIFPMKKIVSAIAIFFVCVFGYSFHSMQKEVLEEYRKNKNQEGVILEEHEKRIEEIKKLSEVQKNILVGGISNIYNEIFFSYMASLNYSEENVYKKTYKPIIFQKAQKEFLDFNERVKGMEDKIKNNIEINEKEKSYWDYIQLNMPLWKYTFEKASNSKNAWLILEEIQKINSENYVPNNEVCEIVKNNIPELKVFTKCE